MNLELHIIQNFAPSNLNRDDTGSPKDCEFGGFRRARISSQCLKRCVRMLFQDMDLLPAEHLAIRTKRILNDLSAKLVERGKKAKDSRAVVERALGTVGLNVVDEGKTQYLLYLGREEMDSILALCEKHWHTLRAAASSPKRYGKPMKTGKEQKKAGKDSVAADLQQAFKNALDGGRAADLALFGRMLADLPEKNIEAACQVAHAFSTHRVSMEFDYYTAVDDLKPEDTTGVGMLGTVEFNSSCFYRYANINIEQLRRNLSDDYELTGAALEAFLKAFIHAIPTGKQNSMAAQNPPSLVMIVVRDTGCWSLANAFLKPVRPSYERDLVEESVAAMDSYWARLTGMYGAPDKLSLWIATTAPDSLSNLKNERVENLNKLIEMALAAVRDASL